MILAGLTVFQTALILGAPLGKYAWGGTHAVLPASLRAASVISIILYTIFAGIILSKVEIVTFIKSPVLIDMGIWVLAVYFAVGVLINGISRSKPERNLMTPVALVLAITTVLIALN